MTNAIEKQEHIQEIRFWKKMKEPIDSPKIIVTNHAEERIRQRIGCKKTVAKLAEKAFLYGISEQDASGQLKRYIEKKRLKKGTANNIRIYNQHVFLFASSTSNILISVFKLPNRLLKAESKIKSKLMQCAS